TRRTRSMFWSGPRAWSASSARRASSGWPRKRRSRSRRASSSRSDSRHDRAVRPSAPEGGAGAHRAPPPRRLMAPTTELIRGLRAIVPERRLLLGRAQLAAYESDALTAFAVSPTAVVVAESADEVIRTGRLCHDLGVPFVPRGSGTSLSGGSLPVEGGVVIALNRLNRILELDPDRRIAVVEPGVINLQVTRAAAAHGLHY